MEGEKVMGKVILEIIKTANKRGATFVEFHYLGEKFTLIRWMKTSDIEMWGVVEGWNQPCDPDEITDWITGPHRTPISIGILQGRFRVPWGHLQNLINETRILA